MRAGIFAGNIVGGTGDFDNSVVRPGLQCRFWNRRRIVVRWPNESNDDADVLLAELPRRRNKFVYAFVA